MAIRRQLWRPDTHSGVEIIEEYDDTDPENTRRVVSVKKDGQTKTGTAAESDYDTVKSENRRKNVEIVPELQKTLNELEMKHVRYSVNNGKIEVNIDHISDTRKRDKALKAVRDIQLNG